MCNTFTCTNLCDPDPQMHSQQVQVVGGGGGPRWSPLSDIKVHSLQYRSYLTEFQSKTFSTVCYLLAKNTAKRRENKPLANRGQQNQC